jgi:hypothetical protein
MADYELHADYNRNGRLDASSTEYSGRSTAPGAIVVPNLDADRRGLPSSVEPGPRIILDGEQPVALANDDEQLRLRIVVRQASAPAGSRFFLRPKGFALIRLRFNDSYGRMLPRDVARQNDLPIAVPSRPGQLDLTLSTRTLPGSPIGHVTDLNTLFRLDAADESGFSVQLLSVDPSGNELLHDEARFTVAPFVILDNSAIALRTYVCDHGRNGPSLIELEEAHRVLGVPLIKLDPTIGSGDTWVQDQFQHALIQGADGWRQVLLHLPRLRADVSQGTTASNLATFVTSHFPSRNVGLFDDLWSRELHVFDTHRAQYRIGFRECVRLGNEMNQVVLLVNKLVDAIKSIAPSFNPKWPETWTGFRAWLPELIERLRREVGLVRGSATQWRETMDRVVEDLQSRVNRTASRISYNPDLYLIGLQTSSARIELRAKDADRLWFRLSQMRHSSNYGGNIDASPPTADAALGKIVIGNQVINGERDFMDPDLLKLLYKQRKQPIVPLDTTWLDVGHVDEVMCFVPGRGSASGFAVLRASTALAMRLIEGARDRYLAGLSAVDRLRYTPEPEGTAERLMTSGSAPVTRLFRGKVWAHFHPPAGEQLSRVLEPPRIYQRVSQAMNGGILTSPTSGGVNISGIRYWPGEGPERRYPADITVKELIYGEQDLDGRSTNAFIESQRLAGIARRLGEAFPQARMLPLPVLYDRVTSVAQWKDSPTLFNTSAFTPNVVNMQVINGRLLIPRPYGPRMLPDDAIAVIVEAMRALGLPSSLIRRLDARFIKRHKLTKGVYWIDRQAPVTREGPPAPYSGQGTLHTVYDGLETEAQVIDQFKDSFPGATDKDLHRLIIVPNRRHFDARGELRDGWRRFELDEGMVDIFEACILAVAEELDAPISWIDSWFYHVRSGEIHCGTNVLRMPGRASRLPDVWSVPDLQYKTPPPQEFEFEPLKL